MRRLLFLLLLVLGCSSSVWVHRAVTPGQATHAPASQVWALRRAGHSERIHDAIRIYRRDGQGYILTERGEIPLKPNDRIVIDGRYEVGETVPGGGVVGRGLNTPMLAFGTVFATVGTGLFACMGAAASAAGHNSGFGEFLVAEACGLGAMVALTIGVFLIGFSFSQPKLIDPNDDAED